MAERGLPSQMVAIGQTGKSVWNQLVPAIFRPWAPPGAPAGDPTLGQLFPRPARALRETNTIIRPPLDR